MTSRALGQYGGGGFGTAHPPSRAQALSLQLHFRTQWLSGSVAPLLPTSSLPHPKLSAQQPGAVLAHGHPGFVVLFVLALLQLCSVTPESEAWPSEFRCITTGCPRCFHSPCAQVSTFPPSCPLL